MALNPFQGNHLVSWVLKEFTSNEENDLLILEAV